MIGETDKARIMRLEAENAKLREELAAYVGHAADTRRNNDSADLVWFGTKMLEPYVVKGVGRPAIVRLLLTLMETPGRVVTYERLHRLIARSEETEIGVIKTVACYLRSALKMMGLDGAIRTAWGTGYVIEAEAAAKLSAMLDETRERVLGNARGAA